MQSRKSITSVSSDNVRTVIEQHRQNRVDTLTLFSLISTGTTPHCNDCGTTVHYKRIRRSLFSRMTKDGKPSLLSKFLAINSKPTKETFPELPDVIVWFRFVLALVYGIWLGMSPIYRSGGANLLFGLNFITFVPVMYCSTFLGADQEAYDNKIIFSGVLSSVALMLLIWTYMYSLEKEADAQVLASILFGMTAGEGDLTADGSDSEGLGSVPPVTQESEF